MVLLRCHYVPLQQDPSVCSSIRHALSSVSDERPPASYGSCGRVHELALDENVYGFCRVFVVFRRFCGFHGNNNNEKEIDSRKPVSHRDSERETTPTTTPMIECYKNHANTGLLPFSFFFSASSRITLIPVIPPSTASKWSATHSAPTPFRHVVIVSSCQSARKFGGTRARHFWYSILTVALGSLTS